MKPSELTFKGFAVAAIIALAAFGSSNVQAQTSATGQADAFATIAQAMTITKTADLNFGIVISAAGTVQVAAQAAPPTVTYTGVTGVTGGTISAAEFDVTGTANAVYAVTTPVGSITLQEAGGNTMTADTFTSGSASGTFTLDGLGNDTIFVGATLNVSAGLNPGLYTSTAPFNVTVDYN
jgi:hypothetical protein